MNQVLIALVYSNLASLLVPVGIGLARWSRLDISLRFAWTGLLTNFLLLSLSMALAMHYIILSKEAPEYVIYAMATLFGLGFALCYALAVPPGRARWLIVGLETLALLGIGLELLMKNNATPISQWAIPAQTVVNTLIPLIYLRYLTRTTVDSLLTVPLFWISMGRLLSALISIFYDLLRVPLTESAQDMLLPWMCFQFTIGILCNLVYGFGFWKAR